MKKNIVLIILLVVTALFTTACGGYGVDTASSATASASSEAPVSSEGLESSQLESSQVENSQLEESAPAESSIEESSTADSSSEAESQAPPKTVSVSMTGTQLNIHQLSGTWQEAIPLRQDRISVTPQESPKEITFSIPESDGQTGIVYVLRGVRIEDLTGTAIAQGEKATIVVVSTPGDYKFRLTDAEALPYQIFGSATPEDNGAYGPLEVVTSEAIGLESSPQHYNHPLESIAAYWFDGRHLAAYRTNRTDLIDLYGQAGAVNAFTVDDRIETISLVHSQNFTGENDDVGVSSASRAIFVGTTPWSAQQTQAAAQNYTGTEGVYTFKNGEFYLDINLTGYYFQWEVNPNLSTEEIDRLIWADLEERIATINERLSKTNSEYVPIDVNAAAHYELTGTDITK